mmetsp:Transcript_34784/g.55872  ORF Transcript_34784/g.55872 Transcript_34784/m.55872 type:complete len:298 (-) Transcript_34784:487-1380(-)
MGSNNSCEFSQYYKAGEQIGTGTFATVKRCTRKSDQKEFAVKIIRKNHLTKKELSNLDNEIAILQRQGKHPHIIRVIDVFQNEQKLKLVTELCEENNLLDRIYESPKRRLEEKECAHILYTITTTVQHLHKQKVVHRDLKPENILFDRQGVLKIADFGSAYAKQNLSSVSLLDMKTNIGTPLYVAPEILTNRSYQETCDLWSLGVILYVMLCGFHPFSARKSLDKMYDNIIHGRYQFSSPLWDGISGEAIEMVKGLMCVDVNKRFTCNQVLGHRWILKHVKVNSSEKHTHLSVAFSG